MKYYLITDSAEKKEVGDYPQTISTEMPDDNGDYELTSRANLSNDYFPAVQPKLELEISKKGKLTDIVSASNIQAKGLFVNEKTKNILQELSIMNHQFFSGSLKYKAQIFPYYWLHIVNKSFYGIDFDASVFCEADLGGEKIREVKINSPEDYYKRNEECEGMNSIVIDQLRLTNEFKSMQPDIFLFPCLHFHIIASEKTVNRLVENHIIGYSCYPAKFI